MSRCLSLVRNRLSDRFVCRSDSSHVYDYVLVLRSPADMMAARSDTLPEYARISKVRRSESSTAPLSFTMPDGTRLTVKVGAPYELFCGVAPGIPPKGKTPGEDVYPLIIRTKGKNLDIETTWDLVE